MSTDKRKYAKIVSSLGFIVFGIFFTLILGNEGVYSALADMSDELFNFRLLLFVCLSGFIAKQSFIKPTGTQQVAGGILSLLVMIALFASSELMIMAG